MPENHSNDEVENHRSGDGDSSGVPPHEPRGETAQRSTDREQNEQIAKLKRNVVIAVAISIFGPLIAILGVVFAGLQWNVARKALDDSRKAGIDAQKNTERSFAIAESQAASMKTLADANKAMADAAKRSAENSGRIAKSGERSIETTREAMRLDQRAWISVPETKGDPVVGREWKIDTAFANTGRTPALIEKMTAMADPIEKGKQPDFKYTRFFGSGTIPPNQVHWTRVIPSGLPDSPSPLTQEGFDLVASGAVVMYVHGRVDYSDVFGEKHWTTFCYLYRPKFGYGACDKNNDVDRPTKNP